MKKFKKALALSMTLAMGLSMVACGGDSKDTGTNADTTAQATEATTGAATEATTGADTGATEAPSGDVITSIDGKVTLDMTGWDASKKIYGYSWDDDFKKKMDIVLENHPELNEYYEGIVEGTKSDDLTITEAAFTSDKYPSLIPADIGSAKYWIEDDTKTLDLKSIGFTDDMIADSYQYAKDFGTYNGQLKAVTWQSTAGSVFYNRAIAKDVWGTDDPAEIQNKLKDWDSFFAAAEELKAKGYKIVSGVKDIYYAICNAKTEAWVQEVDGVEVFKPDSTMTDYAEKAKKLADGGYTNLTGMWDGSWAEQMQDGKDVFCYFGCPWFIGVMTGNGATNGSWGAVVGPQVYYWGGTYVSVGKDTPNPELCKFLLYELCCDNDILVEITNKTGDAVSSSAANDRLVNGGEIAADNAGIAFLGGQNPYGTYAEAAPSIKQGAVTYQDKNIENYICDAVSSYVAGDLKSVDDVMANIKDKCKTELGIEAAE